VTKEDVVATIRQRFEKTRGDAYEVDFMDADDGGVIVIYAQADREATLAIAPVGDITYFVARGPNFRKVGVVLDDAAFDDLSAWLDGGALKEEHLDIGKDAPLPRGSWL
jgi:hypothetical protein